MLTRDYTLISSLHLHSSRGEKDKYVMLKSVMEKTELGKRDTECWRWRRAAKVVVREVTFEKRLRRRGVNKPPNEDIRRDDNLGRGNN